jgi:hypothetical protein
MKIHLRLAAFIMRQPIWRLALAVIALIVAALVVPSLLADDPIYDAQGTARRPLVVINGNTQQIPTADYISTVGGLSTNATAAAAGEIQTTTATVSTQFTTAGQVRQTGRIIPATLTGNENNWNPAGLSTASIIDVQGDNYHVINGLVAQPTGTVITIRNVGPYTLGLTALAGAADPANQFDLLFTQYLQQYQSLTLLYGGSNWVPLGTGGNILEIASLTIDQGMVTPFLDFQVTTLSTPGQSDDVNSFGSFQYDGLGDATVTGFLQRSNGSSKWVQNVSASNLTLASNDGGSLAGNQIEIPGGDDLVLGPNCNALLTYNYPATAWTLTGYGCDSVTIPTSFTNTKNRGTITLVAGSGTATVKSGTVCTCTDTTAVAAVRCAVAGTTLTATGTGTDVIAYHCF